MTWNSRAERTRLLVAGVAVLIAACSPGSQVERAPDSPRPPRDLTALSQPSAQAPDTSVQDRPVEISSVRLRRVRDDTLLTRLMGAPRASAAREPIAIDVVTAEPLGNTERTASLEIYIDEQLIGDTWPIRPNRLIAFVPDRQRLRVGASISVAWLGSEPRTRSRRPIVLTDSHLSDIR
ncbi:MAG: hypothetical protein ACT4P6_14745 [Gemmatimonadaceae bacterium]